MSDRPVARSASLVVEVLGDELLVFDKQRNRAHSLNPPAAAVWRACDGNRDREGLAAETGLDPTAVDLALGSLRTCQLLDGAHHHEAGPRVSRRQAFKKAALTGAAIGVGIPVIRSIAAPSAALAASAGQPCNAQDCPSGSFCSSEGTCKPGTGKGSGASCPGSGSCSYPLRCVSNGNSSGFICAT